MKMYFRINCKISTNEIKCLYALLLYLEDQHEWKYRLKKNKKIEWLYALLYAIIFQSILLVFDFNITNRITDELFIFCCFIILIGFIILKFNYNNKKKKYNLKIFDKLVITIILIMIGNLIFNCINGKEVQKLCFFLCDNTTEVLYGTDLLKHYLSWVCFLFVVLYPYIVSILLGLILIRVIRKKTKESKKKIRFSKLY